MTDEPADDSGGDDHGRMKPRQAGRRFWDHVYYFMPIVLSMLFGALWYFLNAAYVYGTLTQRIEGKLELVNYRLERLERTIDGPRK